MDGNVPCYVFGMFNIGHQAAGALAQGFELANIWQVDLFQLLGGQLTADAGWGAKMFYGACFFLPIYAVTFAVGGFGKLYLLQCVNTKLTKVSS